MSVRPSVRPSVRNASLVRAISPRIFNVEFSNFPKNIPTEVVQQKWKFKFFQTFWIFGQKTIFKIWILSGPYLSNYTYLFVVLAGDISIVQRRGHFFKMLDFS